MVQFLLLVTILLTYPSQKGDKLGNKEFLKRANEIAEILFDNLESKDSEIILFGSVATDKEEPNDIDLMVFEDGSFSEIISSHLYTEEDYADEYSTLGDNFQKIIECVVIPDKETRKMLEETPVDLHVLSREFFQSAQYRKTLAKKHKDPNFFQNAFKSAMRFDQSEGKFKPLKMSELEEKFNSKIKDII